MSTLAQLQEAKQRSDQRQYAAKAYILGKLMQAKPHEFIVDRNQPGHPGLTHVPTGFRLHLPADKIQPGIKQADAQGSPVDLLVKEARARWKLIYDRLIDTGHTQAALKLVDGVAQGRSRAYDPVSGLYNRVTTPQNAGFLAGRSLVEMGIQPRAAKLLPSLLPHSPGVAKPINTAELYQDVTWATQQAHKKGIPSTRESQRVALASLKGSPDHDPRLTLATAATLPTSPVRGTAVVGNISSELAHDAVVAGRGISARHGSGLYVQLHPAANNAWGGATNTRFGNNFGDLNQPGYRPATNLFAVPDNVIAPPTQPGYASPYAGVNDEGMLHPIAASHLRASLSEPWRPEAVYDEGRDILGLMLEQRLGYRGKSVSRRLSQINSGRSFHDDAARQRIADFIAKHRQVDLMDPARAM